MTPTFVWPPAAARSCGVEVRIHGSILRSGPVPITTCDQEDTCDHPTLICDQACRLPGFEFHGRNIGPNRYAPRRRPARLDGAFGKSIRAAATAEVMLGSLSAFWGEAVRYRITSLRTLATDPDRLLRRLRQISPPVERSMAIRKPYQGHPSWSGQLNLPPETSVRAIRVVLHAMESVDPPAG